LDQFDLRHLTILIVQVLVQARHLLPLLVQVQVLLVSQPEQVLPPVLE
jgi:hypothetical protein